MVLAIPLQRSNALTLGNTLWGLVMDARSAALGSRNQVMHGVSHVGCLLDPCMVYSLLASCVGCRLALARCAQMEATSTSLSRVVPLQAASKWRRSNRLGQQPPNGYPRVAPLQAASMALPLNQTFWWAVFPPIQYDWYCVRLS